MLHCLVTASGLREEVGVNPCVWLQFLGLDIYPTYKLTAVQGKFCICEISFYNAELQE